MIETAQTVYLDEAGFTGYCLLDPAQPMFVFAAVAMANDQAEALHSGVISRFRLSGDELKGSSLVKHGRGREAVSWLLDRSVEHSLLLVSDKKYALAGRFFDHIFEPLLVKQNSMFYAIEFHKFIAMILYCHSIAGDPIANGLLQDFETLMRTLDPQQVDVLVAHVREVDLSSALGHILVFTLCEKDKIKKEIEFLRDMASGPRWELELSATSVNFLLASWGERFEALEVHCDRSKPIQSDLSSESSLFNQLIGRRDKFYVRVGKQGRPSVIYNLATEIILEDSKKSPGIQIADVIASSVAYALNNPKDEVSEKWLKLAEEMVAETIVPDFKHIDLTQEGPMINSIVLVQIQERSIRGEDLLADLGQLILAAKLESPSFVLDTEPDISDPSNI